jgi:putative restriction endonuclease
MRYWWVNQNQTYDQEVEGGYLWSPKRKGGVSRRMNPFYETMREVSPGDLIFSFCGTLIPSLGIARSYCWESPQPVEFGRAGLKWDNLGWRVDVHFHKLRSVIRPKDYIGNLRQHLPATHSPLRQDGDGLQAVYLAEMPEALADALLVLIGHEGRELADVARGVVPEIRDDLDEWESKLEKSLLEDGSLVDTDRWALVKARRGQGLYKDRVSKIEARCRITLVENPSHLIASHSKPWRDATNEERLDGENGLLLTPTIDHLFGRGFIGFEDNGRLILSPVAHKPSLEMMGIRTEEPVNVGAFSSGQRKFLDFHRNDVLLKSKKGGRAAT